METHKFDKYPTGGWHYVVVKDRDGEARFLHSIQIEKKHFSRNGNYFAYSLNGRGILQSMSVSVSRFSGDTFIENNLAGYISVPCDKTIIEGFEMIGKIIGEKISPEDYVGYFRKVSMETRFGLEFFRGVTVTKSQYETYKLLTDLPVLSNRAWAWATYKKYYAK